MHRQHVADPVNHGNGGLAAQRPGLVDTLGQDPFHVTHGEVTIGVGALPLASAAGVRVGGRRTAGPVTATSPAATGGKQHCTTQAQ